MGERKVLLWVTSDTSDENEGDVTNKKKALSGHKNSVLFERLVFLKNYPASLQYLLDVIVRTATSGSSHAPMKAIQPPCISYNGSWKRRRLLSSTRVPCLIYYILVCRIRIPVVIPTVRLRDVLNGTSADFLSRGNSCLGPEKLSVDIRDYYNKDDRSYQEGEAWNRAKPPHGL